MLVALVLGGCATPTVTLTEGPREYVATDYDNVLGRWTRTERLFALSELENYLTATATFESWDFPCWAIRRPLRAGLPAHHRSAEEAPGEGPRRDAPQAPVLRRALRGGAQVQRPDQARQRLDRPAHRRHPATETAPQEIVAIKKPNALERSYFPYNTTYRQAFRIRFPRVASDGKPTISPQAKWFGLRFAGAQGNSELVWQLDENKAAAKPVAMHRP